MDKEPDKKDTLWTPGPYLRDGQTVYALQDNPNPRPPLGWDKINRFHCHVSPCGPDTPVDEAEAVAQLFAASPDLYEAARDLLAAIDASKVTSKQDWFYERKAVRDALKKARGEA